MKRPKGTVLTTSCKICGVTFTGSIRQSDMLMRLHYKQVHNETNIVGIKSTTAIDITKNKNTVFSNNYGLKK